MDICIYSVFLLLCISAKIYSVNSSYSHHAFLDRHKKYEMWWKFDETDITVKIKVNTTGWVAWGISPRGKMEAADFVLSWIKNGEKHFYDMHGNILKPTFDTVTDDYNMLSMVEENNSTTTLEFSRKLDLCSGEDASISTDTLRLIYAWADKDPVNKTNINSPVHRGKKSVYLRDYADRVVNQSLPVGHDKFDMTMERYTLTAKETVRLCKPFKLPAMTGKHHLIRIAPNISSGSENNVNYMILHQCKNISESNLGKENECELNITSECTPLHAWAPGGTVFNFPKLAGISLGTENDTEFMMLEVNYDNPDLQTDILDSSGFRIFYTKNLRKYDAGVLAAGVMDEEESIIIPPNQNNFTSYGFCSSRCLNIATSSKTTKPKIFGSLLHTNRHGKKIVVKLVRDSDGNETKRITQDLNYDSNTKVTRYFPKPVEIPPDHSINIECTYSSLDSESALVSGSGDDDESCIAFLYYYPIIKTRKCVSRSRKFNSFARDKLKWSFSDETGRFKSKFVIGKKDFIGKRVFDALRAKDTWKQYFDRRKIRDFEEAGRKDPYDRRCYYRKGRKSVRDAKDESTEHKTVKNLVIENCEKPIEVKTGASTKNNETNSSDGTKTNTGSESSSNGTKSFQIFFFLTFIVFFIF